MRWIYISPHFDDAILSCGGLIWEQSHKGEQASIWTICAGAAPEETGSVFAESLHARWQAGAQAVTQRRQEDVMACAAVSASYRYFSIPDCIYRRAQPDGRYLYASEEALFGPLDPSEQSLVGNLKADLAAALRSEQDYQLVCPLALGSHVDHTLARFAVESLGKELWYYTDYPYVLKSLPKLDELRQAGWHAVPCSISDSALRAWQAAVAMYSSQISTFWPDLAAMQEAIGAYNEQFGGVTLWHRGQ